MAPTSRGTQCLPREVFLGDCPRRFSCSSRRRGILPRRSLGVTRLEAASPCVGTVPIASPLFSRRIDLTCRLESAQHEAKW